MVMLKMRKRTTYRSKLDRMVEQFTTHPSWMGDASFPEMVSTLQGQSPFTYTLSQGTDKYRYILSYVSDNQVVKFKNVRILIQDNKYVLKNCTADVFENIDRLIPHCLKCSKHICKPFTR